jgi:cbb3-type cytochrome oxidase subunit 1
MNFQHLKAAAIVEVRKWRTSISAALLLALPYAPEIKKVVADNLPSLQPYLPENIYKFMGGAVVVAGMVLSIINTYRLVKAANESGNA